MKRIMIALVFGLFFSFPLAKASYSYMQAPDCSSQELTLKLTWGNYRYFGWIPGLSRILEANVMTAGEQYSNCMGY
jgi:hypothetical protein